MRLGVGMDKKLKIGIWCFSVTFVLILITLLITDSNLEWIAYSSAFIIGFFIIPAIVILLILCFFFVIWSIMRFIVGFFKKT